MHADLLAALVAKFGGTVHISAAELAAAREIQLTITVNPHTGEASVSLH